MRWKHSTQIYLLTDTAVSHKIVVMELPHLVAVYASVELNQNILEKSVNRPVNKSKFYSGRN